MKIYKDGKLTDVPEDTKFYKLVQQIISKKETEKQENENE